MRELERLQNEGIVAFNREPIYQTDNDIDPDDIEFKITSGELIDYIDIDGLMHKIIDDGLPLGCL